MLILAAPSEWTNGQIRMDKIRNLTISTTGENVEQLEASRTIFEEEQTLGTLAVFTKAEHIHCNPVIHFSICA